MGSIAFYSDNKYCGHISNEKANKLIEQGILIKKGNTVEKAKKQ